MMRTLGVLAVLAIAAPALAGFTATHAGPINSDGPAGDPTNGVFTYNYAGPDFVPGTLIVQGDATSGGVGSYLSELRWRVINPALQTGDTGSLMSGTTWTGTQAVGPVTYVGLEALYTGTSVGNWEFRAWESYNDTGVDATWTNVSIELQDYVPPPPWTATNYYTEASFVSALAGPYYLEDFTDYTYGDPLDGNQLTQDYGPVNGFAYTASSPNGLWSNLSSLSTNRAFEPIILDFTGSPVTAVGGNLIVTDIDGIPIAGDIIITLADGSEYTIVAPAVDGFFGFSTTVPITSVAFVADAAVNAWAQIDHLYVGQVPEPATLALIALGGLAALRRRR